MTDIAIPIPDDVAADRMDAFSAAWQPLFDDLARGLEAVGRSIRQSMEASAQRWRVRAMMPTLTVRGVMVHGYVAYKEA